MINMEIIFTQKKLKELLTILEISYLEWNGSLRLGRTEKELLSNNELIELSEQFCYLGSDGTTAKVARNEAGSPTYISGSLVLWGLNGVETNVYEYSQKIVIDHSNIFSHSTIRTVLEIRAALCILISRKFKSRRCSECPFNALGCQWQNEGFRPWEHFNGKQLVAILDLPIIFTFIKTLPTLDADNRDFLLTNIKTCFSDIRRYDLPVIFVSQKSTLKNVVDDLASELDESINSIDVKAKSLLNLINEGQSSISLKKGLPILAEISSKMRYKYFSDYDLLEDWLSNIASPSPIFQVKPSLYNNDWEELKFHYFTWGYQEYYENKWVYFPSTWVRIGYSPTLTPAQAHYIACLDMILGKGHSISLTMAHTACNMFKDNYTKLLVDFYNEKRPEKYKLGKNIKDLNKWRFMKNGRG